MPTDENSTSTWISLYACYRLVRKCPLAGLPDDVSTSNGTIRSDVVLSNGTIWSDAILSNGTIRNDVSSNGTIGSGVISSNTNAFTMGDVVIKMDSPKAMLSSLLMDTPNQSGFVIFYWIYRCAVFVTPHYVGAVAEW